MFWIKKDKLTNSFNKVREDLASLYHWIDHFNQKNEEHEKKLLEIDNISKKLEDIHSYYFCKTSELNDTVREINKKIDFLFALNDIHSKDLSSIKEDMREKRSAAHIEKKDPKDKLIRKIKRNSKPYIKRLIIDTIKNNKEISAQELKEMIVDEKGLTSKSSFYRILQELESELEEIDTVQESKYKYYFYKVSP